MSRASFIHSPAILRDARLGHVLDDGAGEVLRGRLSAQILGTHLAIVQHLVDGVLNDLAVGWQVNVAQQLHAAEQHGSGVGHVLADSLGKGVTCTLQTEIGFRDKCVEWTRTTTVEGLVNQSLLQIKLPTKNIKLQIKLVVI